MIKDEIKAYLALTESSRSQWTENEIYWLNSHGAKYYRSGENGVYIKIQQNVGLEIGNYEGAIPHIGEAIYQTILSS